MLECGMLEQDSLTLKRRSAALLKHLVVDEMLLQLLQAEDILTENMAESIMAERTSQKQSWRLLQILPKRGPRAFSCFCSALEETNQKFLSDMLTQAPERDGMERHTKRPSDSSLPLSTPEEAAAKRARTQESMEFSLDADSPIKSPVLPCSADFYHSHFQKAYKMTSSPRGLALVISNVSFDPSLTADLDNRRGGEVDQEVLMKVFTELDYRVSLHVDLTAQAMKSCIESFCRRPDHQAVDSCVVCLLSHGVEGSVYGTDGQLLQLDWVFKAFNNVHCPLLQNKPKMFFIQACRGDEMDVGVEQIDGPIRTNSPSCEQRDAGRERQNESGTNPGQGGNGGRLRIKLPQRSDMICGFASLKGTAAMRNTKKGSWFMQDLDMVLRLHARDTHLADILVQVNGRIKQREGYAPGTPHHRCKEMSEFTSSLCKDLYLFPKFRP